MPNKTTEIQLVQKKREKNCNLNITQLRCFCVRVQHLRRGETKKKQMRPTNRYAICACALSLSANRHLAVFPFFPTLRRIQLLGGFFFAHVTHVTQKMHSRSIARTSNWVVEQCTYKKKRKLMYKSSNETTLWADGKQQSLR